MDCVVEFGGVEGYANGDKSVHLVVFLRDAVVLGVFLEIFGAGDVDEDMAEHSNGIGVPAHHHIAESNVVVGGEVGGHDTGEHGFLVELNVIKRFQCKTEVAEQTVDSE